MPFPHIALAVLCTIFWGLSFIVIKIGVGTTPPLVMAALRFTLAALPAVFFIRKPDTSWRIILAFGFFLGVAQFGLLFAALALGMPAGLASLVMQAQVFFTILFAALLMGERPSASQISGAIIAFGGLALIAWPRLAGSGAVPFAMTVAASAAWGVANIVSKKAGRINMLGLIVWSSLVAPIPLLLLALLTDGPTRVLESFQGLDWPAAGSVAYLAYPATIFAFGMWSYLLSRYPAAVVTPFALLVPITGFISAAIFLGERISLIEEIGAAVILLGLAINLFGARLRQRLSPAGVRAAPKT
jgi:O-acetylserine/cysteine efflux transporter